MNKKTSTINIIFIFLMMSSIIFSAFNGKMKEISNVSFDSAKHAVNFSISLIGIMSFWLGLVRVLEVSGFMNLIAKSIKPVMKYFFKNIPNNHPAMSAMVLNMSANILGLGNAATPLGIKAMIELNKLNPIKGVATNEMILFLVINTSAITIFPLGVIALRAAAGSIRPSEIFLPTFLATLSSTIIGVSIALLLAKIDKKYSIKFNKKRLIALSDKKNNINNKILKKNDFKIEQKHIILNKIIAFILILIFISLAVIDIYKSEKCSIEIIENLISFWLIPFLIIGIISYGFSRGISVYEAIVDGSKQGFNIAIKMLPFLIVIFVAIGLFRSSGIMDYLVSFLAPLTNLVGMPPNTIPIAIIKPLSGQGAYGLINFLLQTDPNSYSSFVGSVMQGSTETTFYILAVYCGSIGIIKMRHALIASLCSDLTGIIVSCLSSMIFWRG